MRSLLPRPLRLFQATAPSASILTGTTTVFTFTNPPAQDRYNDFITKASDFAGDLLILKAGIYTVELDVSYTGVSGTGSRRADIVRNGAGYATVEMAPSGAATFTTFQVMSLITLAAGDKLRATTAQTSGSTLGCQALMRVTPFASQA